MCVKQLSTVLSLAPGSEVLLHEEVPFQGGQCWMNVYSCMGQLGARAGQPESVCAYPLQRHSPLLRNLKICVCQARSTALLWGCWFCGTHG